MGIIDEIVLIDTLRAAEKAAKLADGTRSKSARDDFYSSPQWRNSHGRYEALKRSGGKCECCGASGKDVRLCVDHIKPVRRYWALRFSPENMQVLCDGCNLGKGSWDETDWRGFDNIKP